MSVYADYNHDVREWLLNEGDQYWWKPRYGADNLTTFGLLTTATDPHSVTGVSPCPTCTNATLQLPTSDRCPTCFGTMWTGGFAAGQQILALIALGSHRIQLQEAGAYVAVDGVFLYTMPQDAAVLPLDLIVLKSNPAVRWLVGESVDMPGVSATPIIRVNQVFAQAPDSQWQLPPIP